MPVTSESLFVPLDICTRLHLRRLCGSAHGPVAFLVHGSIENGRIFYSEGGKGLAWFLAQAGWDVFVADLRGRGLSTPPVDAQLEAGQSETIHHDLPALVEAIMALRPAAPMVWISHSWGGVLLTAALARHPEYLDHLKAIVHFGSKRTVRVSNPVQFLKIDFFWNRAAFVLTRLFGYLPTRELGIGGDNESRKTHRQTVDWVKADAWIDPDDGLDYPRALAQLTLPPVLYLAGQNDLALGHPADVKDFLQEVGASHSDYWLLARSEGFLHDYGHVDMLTHPDAAADIFAKVQGWLDTVVGWRQHTVDA